MFFINQTTPLDLSIPSPASISASIPASISSSISNSVFDNSTINITSVFNSTSFDQGAQHSLEQMYLIYFPAIGLIKKYVTPVYYVIGLPGNLLACAVWIQPRMRPSSGCYLAALATTDFIFLILKFIFELQFTWDYVVMDVPILCETFPIIFLAAQYLSVMLVLGFTVERYISVCHPFKRESFCSTSRAIRVIIGLIILSLMVNAVQGYFWSYSAETQTCNVREEIITSDPGSMSVWSVWSWITEMIVFLVIPLSILMLNMLVILETRSISIKEQQRTGGNVYLQRLQSSSNGGGTQLEGGKWKHGNSTGSRQRSSAATTVMLLAVSFYLILSTLPVTVCYVLVPSFPPGNETLTNEEILQDPVWKTHFNYWAVKTLVQEFGMSHFALNFYIYLITGNIFRRELRRLCTSGSCCKRYQRRRREYRDSLLQRNCRHGMDMSSFRSVSKSPEVNELIKNGTSNV